MWWILTSRRLITWGSRSSHATEYR